VARAENLSNGDERGRCSCTRADRVQAKRRRIKSLTQQNEEPSGKIEPLTERKRKKKLAVSPSSKRRCPTASKNETNENGPGPKKILCAATEPREPCAGGRNRGPDLTQKDGLKQRAAPASWAAATKKIVAAAENW
jgi:hypothetical protein